MDKGYLKDVAKDIVNDIDELVGRVNYVNKIPLQEVEEELRRIENDLRKLCKCFKRFIKDTLDKIESEEV